MICKVIIKLKLFVLCMDAVGMGKNFSNIFNPNTGVDFRRTEQAEVFLW